MPCHHPSGYLLHEGGISQKVEIGRLEDLESYLLQDGPWISKYGRCSTGSSAQNVPTSPAPPRNLPFARSSCRLHFSHVESFGELQVLFVGKLNRSSLEICVTSYHDGLLPRSAKCHSTSSDVTIVEENQRAASIDLLIPHL